MSKSDAQLLASTFQNMANMFSEIVEHSDDGRHHKICITTTNYIRDLISSFLEVNLYGTMSDEEIGEWENKINLFLTNDPIIKYQVLHSTPSSDDVEYEEYESNSNSSEEFEAAEDEYKDLEEYIMENEDTYRLLNMAPTKTKDIHVTVRKESIYHMTIAGKAFHNKYTELWKDICNCKDDRYYRLFGLVGPPHYEQPLCEVRSSKECFFPLHTKWKQDINDLKQRLVTILGIIN